jgi:hypothetical protein
VPPSLADGEPRTDCQQTAFAPEGANQSAIDSNPDPTDPNYRTGTHIPPESGSAAVRIGDQRNTSGDEWFNSRGAYERRRQHLYASKHGTDELSVTLSVRVAWTNASTAKQQGSVR